jgi:hypothetical protein
LSASLGESTARLTLDIHGHMMSTDADLAPLERERALDTGRVEDRGR